MGNDIKNISNSIGNKLNQIDQINKASINGIPTNHIQII